jgi:hypothetical protein
MMSPNDIEVLLHCHCTLVPHPRSDAPVIIQAITYFRKVGAIELVEMEDPTEFEFDVFATTRLGAAWVQAICNTPMPTTVFVGADGKEIK